MKSTFAHTTATPHDNSQPAHWSTTQPLLFGGGLLALVITIVLILKASISTNKSNNKDNN
jgi:hypothetical protein